MVEVEVVATRDPTPMCHAQQAAACAAAVAQTCGRAPRSTTQGLAPPKMPAQQLLHSHSLPTRQALRNCTVTRCPQAQLHSYSLPTRQAARKLASGCRRKNRD